MVVALSLPMTYSGIYVIGYVLDVSIQGFGHRINICDHDVWRNTYTYRGTFIVCVGSMYQTFLFRDSDIGINICDHDVWRNIYTYGGTFIVCVGSMYQTFLFRDSDIGINICDHDVWRNIYTYGGTFIVCVGSMASHLVCRVASDTIAGPVCELHFSGGRAALLQLLYGVVWMSWGWESIWSCFRIGQILHPLDRVFSRPLVVHNRHILFFTVSLGNRAH